MQARDFFDEPQQQPAPSEPRREQAEPARTRVAEPRRETPPPVSAAAMPAAPAVVFHAVSEHDAAVEESHQKPARRRRQDHAQGEAAPSALQLVETQAEVVVPAPVAEDELPRRTRPRRRRGGEIPNEPLKLVETQPGAESTHPDNQP